MAKILDECVICRGNNFTNLYSNLFRCKNCHLVSAKEIPNKEEIDKLYQQEYFFGMEYSDYKADRRALESNFRKRIRRIKRYINKKSSVVEIGSAYGYFLNLIKDNVGTHIGFEVSEEGVEYSKENLRVNAVNQDFTKYKFNNSIDLIIMWDVIEHLSEPGLYLQKASNVLKKGGRIALTTGDVDTFIPKIRKSKWRMIHPPTHLYYFSSETITKILNKYGFEVDYIKYPAISRNLGSVIKQIYSNQKAVGKSGYILDKIYRVADLLKLTKLNIPINTFDVMEVLAHKK